MGYKKNFAKLFLHKISGIFLSFVLILSNFYYTPFAFAAEGATCLSTGEPIASFFYSASEGLSPLTVNFDATSSIGCGDEITNYSWDFGDGSSAVNPATSHTFETGIWNAVLTVTDESGMTDDLQLQINVREVNQDPVAENDTAATDQNESTWIFILENDSDPEKDAVEISLVSGPTNGNVALSYLRNSYIYTPNPDFYGTDSFVYAIEDKFGGSDTATVNIIVNKHITARDDLSTTNEDQSVTINVIANDSDTRSHPLYSSLYKSSLNGTVHKNFDNTFTYVPNPDFYGTDSFQYELSDGSYHEVATVTVVVNSVNDKPIAVVDTAVTNEDQSVTIAVLANDSDKDDVSLRVQNITPPSNGSVTLNNDNSITYTPAKDYNGSNSFIYTIADPSGEISQAMVNVTVKSVNDAPIAGFTYTQFSGASYSFNSSESYDIDGTLTYHWNFGDGLTSNLANPTHKFKGKSSWLVTLTVTDNNGASSTVTKKLGSTDSSLSKETQQR